MTFYYHKKITLTLMLILTGLTQSGLAIIDDAVKEAPLDLTEEIPYGRVSVATNTFQDIATGIILGDDDDPAKGSRTVLTCAHVLDDLKEDDFIEFYSPHADKTVRVCSWTIHPQYGDQPQAADLAILELEEPIPFKSSVMFSPSLNSAATHELSSFGYGLTSTSGSSSTSLGGHRLNYNLISYPGEMAHFFKQTFQFDDLNQIFFDPFQFNKVLCLVNNGYSFEYIPSMIPGQATHCAPGMGDSGALWFMKEDDGIKGLALTSRLHVDVKIQSQILSNHLIGKPIQFNEFPRNNPFFKGFTYIDLSEFYPGTTILTPLHPHTRWIKDQVEIIEEAR